MPSWAQSQAIKFSSQLTQWEGTEDFWNKCSLFKYPSENWALWNWVWTSDVLPFTSLVMSYTSYLEKRGFFWSLGKWPKDWMSCRSNIYLKQLVDPNNFPTSHYPKDCSRSDSKYVHDSYAPEIYQEGTGKEKKTLHQLIHHSTYTVPSYCLPDITHLVSFLFLKTKH